MTRRRFMWEDPLLLEDQLGAEERDARDSARSYAQVRLMPRVLDAFRHECSDVAIFREMGALDLLGPMIQGYGCAAANHVCHGLIAREIEHVDSGYRSMLRVQSSLVTYPLYVFGNAAQQEKYLPRLARRELIGCFG